MCGICGVITKQKITTEEFHLMNQTMISRGPDDEGEELFILPDDRKMWLGHKRLSIIDLSNRGHQPFHSADNQVIVVFNGEIYNYQELKKELRDYNYCSNCDTEVIIAAYERWQEKFVEHIDGMFAIGLYDKRKNQLLLVRDRVGKKPLYYSIQSDTFVFASTMNAIMATPNFEKRINKKSLPSYLLHTFIGKDQTILENVYKLLPGEMIIYKENLIRREQYWSYVDEYKKAQNDVIRDYECAKNEVTEALIKAVSRRLVADVPVGLFLSGGYDSVVVAAIANSLTDKQLQSFSVGYKDGQYNETEDAAKIAKYLRVNHNAWVITEEDFLNAIEQVVEISDEPFAENAAFLTLLVSKFAQEKIKVVLTGDGGDEVFCGYSRYDQIYRHQKRKLAASVLGLLPSAIIEEKLSQEWQLVITNTDSRYRTQMMDFDRATIVNKMIEIKGVSPLFDETNTTVKNWQVSRLLLDGTNCLPDNNLVRVDRMTMACSMEARCPLLDVDLIKTMFRVPHEYKYNNGCKKYILKDIVYDYVPRELMDRPKKTFSPSLKPFITGVIKDDILRVTSVEYLSKQGIFNPEFTSSWIRQCILDDSYESTSAKMPFSIVMSVYMFQKWYERYFL